MGNKQLAIDKGQYNMQYISKEQYYQLTGRNEEVGKLLNHMINNPEKY